MDVDFLRWQYVDGYYGVITKNRFKIGVRHIQMLYMLVASVAFGMIRGSIGIAILAINDRTRQDDTYIKVYSWNHSIQGAILSLFFIGHAVMLVPFELFLRNIGGKVILTTFLLINGALFIAMPTIINKGGWMAACFIYLFLGMSQACFFVVNQSLINSWLPPSEKRIFSYLIYGGIQLGIIVSLPVFGLLSTARLGWELVYYVLAMIGLSMAAIFATLTGSTPESHHAVGDSEREFIKETIKYYRKKDLRKPWREILQSSRFWAVTSAHAASNCLFTFFLVYAPVYLMTFGITLKKSSDYCVIPFIAMVVVYIVLEPIMNWIHNIKYIYYIFSANFFRKTINCVAAFGITMGLFMLLDYPCKWNCPTIVVFATILGLLGWQMCGFLSSYRDMSENFSGTLMMFSGAFSGIFTGLMICIFGAILGDKASDPMRWQVIFLTLASLYVICTVVYTIFGSHERQRWDFINDKKYMGHSNGVMNIDQVQLEENGHISIDTAL